MKDWLKNKNRPTGRGVGVDGAASTIASLNGATSSSTGRSSLGGGIPTGSSTRSVGGGCSTLTKGATDTGTRSMDPIGEGFLVETYFDISGNTLIPRVSRQELGVGSWVVVAARFPASRRSNS